MIAFALAWLAAVLPQEPVAAPTTTVEVRGGTVWTMAGEPIADGIVLVRDGKIAAVGRAADVAVPAGVQVLRADRQGIGGLAHAGTVNFAVATQPMQPGARYYMTTDGYVDQFNATGRRKLGQAGFEGLLAELQPLPLQRRAAVLAQRFEQWHGSYRQLDDVLVMGVSL